MNFREPASVPWALNNASQNLEHDPEYNIYVMHISNSVQFDIVHQQKPCGTEHNLWFLLLLMLKRVQSI